MYENEFCECTFSNLLEKKFTGLLSFGESKDGKLIIKSKEAISEFSFLSKNNLEYIYGRTSNGKLFTIINPFNSSSTIDSEARYTFIFSDIIIGKAINNIKDLEIKKVEFKLNGIDFWIRNSGFELKNDTIKTFDLEYKIPESINIFKNDELEIDVNYNINRNFNASPKTITFNEYKTFSISFIKPVTITKAKSIIFRFCALINLVTYMFDQPNEIRIAEDGKFNMTLFDLNKNQIKIKGGVYNFLLNFSKFQLISQVTISNWLTNYSRDEHIIQILLSFFNNNGINQIGSFLEICKGLESFNATYHNQPIRSASEFKHLKESIKEKLDFEEYSLIENSLIFANNPNLYVRLKILYDIYNGKLFTKLGLSYDFFDLIKNTRNYYTHFSKKNKIIPLNNLHHTSIKGHFALTFMYLCILGFEKEDLESSMLSYFDSNFYFVV
ncbi:ApeA N-terminal domain 1-containing protein [Sphingobacterium daejeonense]|uniref:ApeA N-terminal domain 1-containing protein n=1 Tax=Sphingobacterium daejeonense TaxID=371142 RepID=UPI0010C36A69|nr:HEPN domain-containing protein [Sphingobacterium daejeonense]VTQ01741.1 Uncharacterised protein [Sphingobacterium daejeonense]